MLVFHELAGGFKNARGDITEDHHSYIVSQMTELAPFPQISVLTEQNRLYSAWLEVEIGLDQQAILLPHSERVELFSQRIENALASLENAAPGIRTKLEVFPDRPFAFTAHLSEQEIRAIWHLPELRLLSDRSANKPTGPEPDKNGSLPFIVIVHMHLQAENSTTVEVEQITLLINAATEAAAMDDAILQCTTDMPEHSMGDNFNIRKRWWTAERAYLNVHREEERRMYRTAMMLDSRQSKPTKNTSWQTDSKISRVTYGGPEHRTKTWEWMLN